jgi:hypothetical protein
MLLLQGDLPNKGLRRQAFVNADMKAGVLGHNSNYQRLEGTAAPNTY